MSDHLLQLAALCGAFWTAVFLFDRDATTGHTRFVFGLALGAVFAHLGWAMLNLTAVFEYPWAVVDPTVGFSVLFVPLGLLLLAPWSEAFATLPLALAVARVGCLAAGCCHGENGEPTPLYEIAGLVVLHGMVSRLPDRWVIPVVLGGFGLIRLAVEPMRSIPPLGEPVVPIEAIAAFWVALGIAIALRSGLSSCAPSGRGSFGCRGHRRLAGLCGPAR